MGNNSSIFTSYNEMVKEQHTAKEILAAYTVEGLVGNLVVRNESVIVNDLPGNGITLSNEAACRGALTGLIDAFHVRKYAVLELGLHLFKTAEELRGITVLDNVGYLTSSYMGSNKRLLALRPESGVATLRWFGGTLVVQSVVAEPTKNEYNESEAVTKARRVFYKHVAIDMYLAGVKVCIFPSMGSKVEVTPGTFSYQRSPERVAAFLRQYTRNLEVSPEQAEKNYVEASFIARTRRLAGTIDTAVNQGILAVPADHTIWVGKDHVVIETMIGKKVSKMRGNIRIGDVTVTPSNLAQLLVEAKNLGLKFVEVQAQ